MFNHNLSTSGEQNVTLRHVQRQLTGDYKCEVSSDGPLFHTEIRVAHLIVADLPLDDPVLNIRDTKVEVGKPIRLECTQSGSHPAANISWFINNKQNELSNRRVINAPLANLRMRAIDGAILQP
ncbi:hypothetical protein HUJ05_011057 [Dendroctonus ponderosae]|nr:hypothetical protein HUJ05_011057 [Dendroctonus ponderosae]